MQISVPKAQDISGFNLTTTGVHRIVLDPGTYKPDVRIRALGGDDEEHTYTAVEPKKAAEQPAPQPVPQPTANQPAPGQPTPQEPAALALDVPMGDLRAAGAYEVELLQHTGATEKRLFARNVPVEESRLVRFTEADLRRVYPAEIVDKVTFREEVAGLGSGQGQGEMWRALAAAMLLALLLETLFAWRFGRR